jgi:hypothetical protein
MRILVATAGRRLADILRHRDPQRALTVYNHSLLRLAEIKNNVKARREETKLLAGSSYALRRLNRTGEAKERIDTALSLLRDTKDYPAARIQPDSDADVVLRANGDHLAAIKQPRQAATVYLDLLEKITASKPDPHNDLRHATSLSRLYETIAALHRRNGNPDQAEQMATLREALWRHWDRKLNNNSFVRRQLLESSR